MEALMAGTITPQEISGIRYDLMHAYYRGEMDFETLANAEYALDALYQKLYLRFSPIKLILGIIAPLLFKNDPHPFHTLRSPRP